MENEDKKFGPISAILSADDLPPVALPKKYPVSKNGDLKVGMVEGTEVINELSKIKIRDFIEYLNLNDEKEMWYYKGFSDAIKTAKYLVKNVSESTDVMPIRYAKWIPVSDDINDPRMKCSRCGSIEKPLFNSIHCPSCGAVMTKTDFKVRMRCLVSY